MDSNEESKEQISPPLIDLKMDLPFPNSMIFEIDSTVSDNKLEEFPKFKMFRVQN